MTEGPVPMPLREDLLNPIPGENPSGENLRYQPVYDKIKEARREEDALEQGDWQRARKLADWPQVIKLCQEAIATKSKDLQLAAWLAEALAKTQGYGGMREGLVLCLGLLENFWDTLYPEIEDGDVELRAAPLQWIGDKFDFPLKSAPLVRAKYDWYQFKDSRTVGYEEQIQGEAQRVNREKMLKEGKLAPEAFDKAFEETPKAFYVQAERDLDGIGETVAAIDRFCSDKLGTDGPSFSRCKSALEEVRHTVHALLEKKREKEPDAIAATEATAAPTAGAGQALLETGQGATAGQQIYAAGPASRAVQITLKNTSEPPDRQQAVASIAAAAAFLRQREPQSPAPYLMIRGLRWGELRAAAHLSDPTLLEGPPTELRQQIKRLALGGNWRELLQTAESAMALPCSRAWLDLQRLVVEACQSLGSDYKAIRTAICSELRALLLDLPELLDASLLDDTPAANPETKAWLLTLIAGAAQPQTRSGASSGETLEAVGRVPANGAGTSLAGWPRRDADSYSLASAALEEGQAEKAFKIMHDEIARQSSGRGRFERLLQLVELCVAAGKESIAQPLLDDLLVTIDSRKLEEWEDPSLIARALSLAMKTSKRVQEDPAEMHKLFERICRLDPVRALDYQPSS